MLWPKCWHFEMDVIHCNPFDWGHFIWKQLRGRKHIITKEWEERSGNTSRLDHSLKMDMVFTVSNYNKSKTCITTGEQIWLWTVDFLMQSKRKQFRLMMNVKFRSKIEWNVTYFICSQNGGSLKRMCSKSGHNGKLQRNKRQIGNKKNLVHVHFLKSKGKM